MKWFVRVAAVILVLAFFGLMDLAVTTGWPVFLLAGGLWALVWAIFRTEVRS